MAIYNEDFFKGQAGASLLAAQVVVPILIDALSPNTVVDVGAGSGTWLSVFRQHGADVHAIEGDWVRSIDTQIPKERYTFHDLERPFTLAPKFDLCLSLEVAEHLPESSADGFVESLSTLSDCIVFSAAIPEQGGVNHVNEQWPSYWAKKFERHGYAVHDVIRPIIWREAIKPWYRQNMLLFTKGADGNFAKKIEKLDSMAGSSYLDLVHPEYYMSRTKKN